MSRSLPAASPCEATRAPLHDLWARALAPTLPPTPLASHPAAPGTPPAAPTLALGERALAGLAGPPDRRDALAQRATPMPTAPAPPVTVATVAALRAFLCESGDMNTLGARLALLRALLGLDAGSLAARAGGADSAGGAPSSGGSGGSDGRR